MRNSGGSISSSNNNRTISTSTSLRTNDITKKAQYNGKRDNEYIYTYIYILLLSWRHPKDLRKVIYFVERE